ncbi:6-hydroxy-D-nicotine oxidase [Streptomyces camponoticapitis]|uniref:6-hydroxy-D-nicotine oxidase n=1 Tax=Streptomyces camponoticapitis TaxID=1616125 RepID=A0ABQ2ERE8_9ACTN|nr:FAD-binding oxidoreductase [Streptomyces camponoticapitis]GGK16937.1 6-hydroxy-D-nicotine oxidase [Streptomyces camponoticapitis]
MPPSRHGVPLSVLAGGHDWAGRAIRPDGLVIDLSGMREVSVDAVSEVATLQGGATAHDVVTAALPHGLVAVTGTVRTVDMAELTLGGGYGPLSGRFGLALDNLVGADVVLADGRLVRADAEHDAELLWALRGGGGNFGVAVALDLRLHPVRELLAGLVIYPWDQATQVWQRLGRLLADAPDELTLQSGAINGPEGRPVLFLAPVWSGPDHAAGRRALEELQQLGAPLPAQLAAVDQEGLLALNDEWAATTGKHFAIRTRTLPDLGPDAVAILVEAGGGMTSPLTGLLVHHFHGAATRVPQEDTAFGIRRPHYMVEIIAGWEPDDSEASLHRAWADTTSAALARHALPGGYRNLLAPDAHDQVPHSYGGDAARLLAAKRRYDPDNVFTSIPLPNTGRA